MTLLLSAFDNPSATFAPIQGVSGNGLNIAGASNPAGISGVLTIENGMMRAFYTDTQADTIGPRTEIYLTPDTFGVESWVTWEFMLPSTYWTTFTGVITMGQMHDTADGGDPTRQPNIMLQFVNKTLQIALPSATLPTESTGFRRVPGINVEFDRWYSVCMRFLWSSTSTGFRELFLDRVPMLREWNLATAYSDTIAPYLKLGLYITNGGNPCGDKVLYVRNLKRWSGNDGYQTVMGGLPTPPQRIMEI